MIVLFIIISIVALTILVLNKNKHAPKSLEKYIQARLNSGESKKTLEANLLKDLEKGGPIFGEFRNGVRATTNGSINKAKDSIIFADLGKLTPYRWVATLKNTCPDCLNRHGQIKTWDEWEKVGLPRTGHTSCKDTCHCLLLPAKLNYT